LTVGSQWTHQAYNR